MKLLNGKKIAHSLILIPVLFILISSFFIYACGGGGGSGSSGAGSTGSVAFDLGLQSFSNSRAVDLGVQSFSNSRAVGDAGTTSFECVTEAHVIDVIEAEVRDENDELLTGPDQFPCQDRQGTLTGVEPGDYRVVVVFARDSSGAIIYSGKSAPGPVIAGQTNDFGTIILSPPGTAIVEGTVIDADTSSPLAGVTIDMMRGGYTEATGLSDSIGFYSLAVPPASGYEVEFSKEGFLTEILPNILVVADTVTVLEPVRLIPEALDLGNVSGTIVNALDGKGVSGLTVTLREGIGVEIGPSIVAPTTTDSGGFYSFANLDPGNYTAEAGGSGFITTFFSVISVGGTTTADQDAVISPVLPPDETRIILTWGETPADLDSHLTGPLPDGSRFHVYFSNKVEGGAILDLDDTFQFGPETTTIQEQIDGVYRFSVHDFTNSFITGGDAENSRFFGTYSHTYSGTIGVCPQTEIITVGSDPSRLGEIDYLFIPATGDSSTDSFEDDNGDSVTRSVLLSGNTIFIDETGECSDVTSSPCWSWDVIAAFATDFSSGTISGVASDADLSVCQGPLSGNFVRESGAVSSFALAASGAQVRVIRDSGLVETFNVPVSQEGTLWTVFELSGDTLTPINSMSYESDSGSIP